MQYLADTNFLIGRWRNQENGREAQWIRSHSDATVGLAWVVKGEFLRGARLARHHPDLVATFLDRYKTLWPDDATLQIYAEQYALLTWRNQMIGMHDLWIAAGAIQHNVALLTRNVREFSRIDGLLLETY